MNMSEKRKIVVTSALPYANGDIHLGHLVELRTHRGDIVRGPKIELLYAKGGARWECGAIILKHLARKIVTNQCAHIGHIDCEFIECKIREVETSHLFVPCVDT